MSQGDIPLTRRELARLLRAFAHMVEVSASEPQPDQPKTRRHMGLSARSGEASTETRARAKAALRKLGVLP
jgi:hypothetical protein